MRRFCTFIIAIILIFTLVTGVSAVTEAYAQYSA